MTVKSLLTYGLLLRDYKLLAYSIAQLVYSVILIIAYPRLVKIEMPLETTPIKDTLGDKKNEDGSIVSILPAQKKLLTDFSKSCLLKFFLTEGEKLIMVTSNAFSKDE